MDSYSAAFLDSNTYQCEYYQNVNLSDDYLGCIKLPEVDEISIIESYVQQLNVRKLKKVLGTAKDDIDIIHKFH